jgi:FkbM family methyltransferase
MNPARRLKKAWMLLRRSGFRYWRMAHLKPPFWLRANGSTTRLLASDELGAGSCYAEVVVEDCYGLFEYARTAPAPQVIVDIGANFGAFSRLCSMLFPQADIYAYEPNAQALRWLAVNAAGTRIRVMPCAVADAQGARRLTTRGDSTLSRLAEDGEQAVECIGATQVAEGRRIDLLKMDCEGGEWLILRDASLLRRTRALRLEYHLAHAQRRAELEELIERAGHRIEDVRPTRDGGRFGLLSSTLEHAA